MTTFNDPILDHRARQELARLEAEHRREQARIDQSSIRNSPEERVRVWEKLHQVLMPKDAAHPILQYVAQCTALDLDTVREVQQARALARAST